MALGHFLWWKNPENKNGKTKWIGFGFFCRQNAAESGVLVAMVISPMALIAERASPRKPKLEKSPEPRVCRGKFHKLVLHKPYSQGPLVYTMICEICQFVRCVELSSLSNSPPLLSCRFSSTVPTCENVFNLNFFLDNKKRLCQNHKKLWQWTIPFFNRKHLRKGSIFYCYCSFTRAKKKFVVDFSFFLLILLASFFGKIRPSFGLAHVPQAIFFEQQIAGYIEILGRELWTHKTDMRDWKSQHLPWLDSIIKVCGLANPWPRNTWPRQNPINPLNPVAIFWWPGPFDPQR